MQLYDPIIREALARLSQKPARRYAYEAQKAWKDSGESELVMQREAAYELGGDGKPAVNFSCVTSDASLVARDEVIVIGKDLSEIGGSVPFARLAFILIDDIKAEEGDTEPLFRAIQDIDFVKYHVFPEGYMVRTSAENHREQVRISKKAKAAGISFERVGCDYIRRYKGDPHIRAVKLVFVTDPDVDYKKLAEEAKTVHDITLTLSKILEGMPTDCSSCNLKPICDEVEGMKELHFGQNKAEFRG
ncbi:MAG: carbon monoxide dehydrogenase [Clostridia bacterium]|nr:carbon monoxide dehydrogenase [Clostridia bacterium]